MNGGNPILYFETWNDDAEEAADALRNTLGGTIYVGARSEWDYDGASDGDLALLARYEMDNRPFVEKTDCLIGRKRIAELRLKRGLFPASGRRGYYVYEDGTVPVSANDIERFIEYFPMRGWSESWICRTFEPDAETVAAFDARCRERGWESGDSPSLVLLGNHPAECRTTNAQRLFFSGAETPGIRVETSVKATHMGREVYSRFPEGSLFLRILEAEKALAEAWEALKEHDAGLSGDFPYPEAAVREALTNAFVNHDYQSRGGIAFELNRQCLRVSNSGGPPAGIGLPLLYGRGISLPRSPGIAKALKTAGMTEGNGKGLRRMSEAYRGTGLESPQYALTDERFTVRLLPHPDLRPAGNRDSLRNRGKPDRPAECRS